MSEPVDASRRQRLQALGLLCAAVQFLVLTVIAMVVYPGGATFHERSGRYLFFGNFFSDLGATRTVDGHGNLASHVLFAIALGVVGIAFAVFAPVWRSVSRAAGSGAVAAAIAFGSGVISGLGFIGIAATPWNLVYDAHNLFVRIAFGLLLIFVGAMTVVQMQTGRPRAFTVVNLAYLAVLVGYVVMLFAGPGLDTAGGFRAQVIAQKIIVYSSIVNLGIQAFGVLADPAAGGFPWRGRRAHALPVSPVSAP